VHVVFPLISSTTWLGHSVDVSGHVFLLCWSMLTSLVSCSSLTAIYHDSKPANVDHRLLYCLVAGLTLVYVVCHALLLLVTLFFYHTVLEKMLGALFSIVGVAALNIL